MPTQNASPLLLLGWSNHRNLCVVEMRFATFFFKAWNLLALSIQYHVFKGTYCAMSQKQAEIEQETDILKSKWRKRQYLNSYLNRNSSLCFLDYFGSSNIFSYIWQPQGLKKKHLNLALSLFFSLITANHLVLTLKLLKIYSPLRFPKN